MELSEYLLADTGSELSRLRIQAQAWEADAEALIDRIGVKPGWRCADLGCGEMGILGPLARRVGRDGSVVGTDLESKVLLAACAHAEEHRLTNVQLVTDNAYGSSLPSKAFDLVHARFVVAPCGRAHALLAEMIRLARPGGFVALQEPAPACWTCEPRSPAFDELKHVVLRAFAERGGDFGAGMRLPRLLRDLGCTDVGIRPAVLCLSGEHPYKRAIVHFARTLRPRILDGIMTEAELDATVAAVEAVVADPKAIVTSFMVMQVWGRTPAG